MQYMFTQHLQNFSVQYFTVLYREFNLCLSLSYALPALVEDLTIS